MQKLELSIFLRHMIVKSYLIKYLIAKAKKRKTRRLYGHNLSHLFHGDLGLWPCLNQMKILKTLRPLPLPVPSPVCTEWLLPTPDSKSQHCWPFDSFFVVECCPMHSRMLAASLPFRCQYFHPKMTTKNISRHWQMPSRGWWYHPQLRTTALN